MDIRKILAIIFFFLTILLVVQLAPNIQTANSTAFATFNASAEKASMIGLSVLMPFGDVLIIISIMVAAGLLAMHIRDGLTITDIVAPVGLVIACIVALNFFDTMIGSFDTLIAGSSGFGKVFYGVVLLLVYLLIIALPNSYNIYHKISDAVGKKRGKKGASSGTGAVAQ